MHKIMYIHFDSMISSELLVTQNIKKTFIIKRRFDFYKDTYYDEKELAVKTKGGTPSVRSAETMKRNSRKE